MLLFFMMNSQMWWIMLSLITVLLFVFIMRRTMMNTNYTASNTYYQAPTPSKDATQQPQQSYPSYQQGYQGTPQTPSQDEKQYYYSPEQTQDERYAGYEQPHAEYPQQLPPI
jgi:hypothetical protein